MSERSPITFTTNPRLSLALQGTGPEFEKAMESAGVEQTYNWLRNRAGDAVDEGMLREFVQAWFEAETPEERVMPRVELAELLAEADDETTELLWDASMRDAFDRNDSEQAIDAVAQLAQIAENNGDALTAAEFYIEFLNWRRQEGHVSDPEYVHQAFEEIIRLAELENQPVTAARFGHAHAQFTRVDDQESETATEGDWASETGPFTGWE